MTPPIELYELYEEVKRELCKRDDMTPEKYTEMMQQIAEDLGI